MAGAILGGWRGVAAAIVQRIKANSTVLHKKKKINADTVKALHAAWQPTLHMIVNAMETETLVSQEAYSQEYNKTLNLITANHNLIMCQFYKSNVGSITRELDVLLTTGMGRWAPDFQTILGPERMSCCAEGLCKLNLAQMYSDNAQNGYMGKIATTLCSV